MGRIENKINKHTGNENKQIFKGHVIDKINKVD